MKNLNKLNSDNSDGNKDANKPEQIIDWDKIKDFQTTDYLLEHEDFSNARIEKAYPRLEGESESDYKDRIEGIKQLFEKQKSIVDSEGKRTDYYMSSEQGKSELHAEEKLDEIIGKIDEKVQSGVLSKESGEKIKNKVLDNAVEKIENIRGEYRDQQLDRETKAYIAWLAQNAPEDTRETIDTNAPAKDDASVFQIPKGDQDNPKPESSTNDDGRLDAQQNEAPAISKQEDGHTDPSANKAFASNSPEPLPDDNHEIDNNDEIEITPEALRNIKDSSIMRYAAKNNTTKGKNTEEQSMDQPSNQSFFDRWNNRRITTKEERDRKTDERIRALGKIAPFLVPKMVRNELSETEKHDRNKTPSNIIDGSMVESGSTKEPTSDKGAGETSNKENEIVFGKINQDKNVGLSAEEKKKYEEYKSLLDRYKNSKEKQTFSKKELEKTLFEYGWLKVANRYDKQPKDERDYRVREVLSFFEDPDDPYEPIEEEEKEVMTKAEKYKRDYANVPNDQIPQEVRAIFREANDYALIRLLGKMKIEQRKEYLDRLKNRYNISS